MIVKFMLRRRPSLDESVPALNAAVVDRLSEISKFWSTDRTPSDAIFDLGEGEIATLDLHNALAPGLAGQIVYAARFAGYLNQDDAKFDDYLVFELNSELTEYADFCENIFPELLKIWGPYRAVVETDEDVALDDWEIICDQSEETRRDINGRDSIFRIWPVSYFDDLLCRRSFGLSAKEVVDRARAECQKVELIDGGAFLLVTSEIIMSEALDALNARIMNCLVS